MTVDEQPIKKCLVSAPGKIILCGEHAVVHGSAAIAAAIEMRTLVAAKCEPSDHATIEIYLTQLKFTCEFALSSIPIPEKKCLNDNLKFEFDQKLFDNILNVVNTKLTISPIMSKCISAILYLFVIILYSNDSEHKSIADNLGKFYKLQIDGNIPLGQGLGSSASVCVAVAASLLHLLGKADLNKFSDREKSDSLKSLINELAFLGEICCHGKPSGLDNTVSTFGNAVFFKKGCTMDQLTDIPPLRLLITDTRIEKSTALNVLKVSENAKLDPEAYRKMFDEVNNISRSISDVLIGKDCKPDEPQMYDRISSLLSRNQALLEKMEVSHPKIENIVEWSEKFQIGTTKLTGGGGGGCTITLLRPDCGHSQLEEFRGFLAEQGLVSYEAEMATKGVSYYLKSESLKELSLASSLIPYLDDASNWI